MMREGILVAEESPEVLMSRCNTTTLEEAFLKESRKQNNSSSKFQVPARIIQKGLKKCELIYKVIRYKTRRAKRFVC